MAKPGSLAVAYIGLGSNLGNSVETLEQAKAGLRGLSPDDEIICSSFYRSAPIGFLEQPDFVNAVCRLETVYDPESLLQHLLKIERDHGRDRSGQANAPRTLDLDLLLYDDLIISLDGLEVPHPRLHERAFVLYPLLEIAPDLVIPGHGSVRDLMRHCEGQTISRIEDPA